MRNWRSARRPLVPLERSFFPFFPMPQGISSLLSLMSIFFLLFPFFPKRSGFLFYFPLCHKFNRTSVKYFFRSRGTFVILTSFWQMEVANGVLPKLLNSLFSVAVLDELSPYNTPLPSSWPTIVEHTSKLLDS